MAYSVLIAETSIPYESCLEQEEFYNGSNRRVLTFVCEREAIAVEDLYTLLSDEDNLERIECRADDTGVINVYQKYPLMIGIGIEPYAVTQYDEETGTDKTVYVDKLVWKVGKRTYIEQRLHDLGLD